MQKKGRYNFDLVMRHSNMLALESRKNNKEHYLSAKQALSFLGTVIDEIGNEKKTHHRNVRMALATRFYNHLFSQIILTERGLYLDASNAFRSATETAAFYWLVSLDPSSSSLYDNTESPQPVEIRKKLENLDVDVSELRNFYKYQSSMCHVGNSHDNMQIKWREKNEGEFSVGGQANHGLDEIFFSGIFGAIAFFLKYDPTYEVFEPNKQET